MSVENDADAETEATENWPELVARVYDEIDADGSQTIRFSDMDVHVPSRTGEDADRAHWTLDGDVELNPRN